MIREGLFGEFCLRIDGDKKWVFELIYSKVFLEFQIVFGKPVYLVSIALTSNIFCFTITFKAPYINMNLEIQNHQLLTFSFKSQRQYI